jgi:hypothetical protein
VEEVVVVDGEATAVIVLPDEEEQQRVAKISKNQILFSTE